MLVDAPRDGHGAASGPLTEEEAEDLAKQYIDDAVETVAEMQLTASQLRVRVPTMPNCDGGRGGHTYMLRSSAAESAAL